jgi:hypothetical protein
MDGVEGVRGFIGDGGERRPPTSAQQTGPREALRVSFMRAIRDVRVHAFVI